MQTGKILMDKVLVVLKYIWYIPRMILVFIIGIYQKTISPDHGALKKLFPYGYCRFTPSCSSYGKEIIRKRGVIIGGVLAFYRILRCNPWNDGGYDPPK